MTEIERLRDIIRTARTEAGKGLARPEAARAALERVQLVLWDGLRPVQAAQMDAAQARIAELEAKLGRAERAMEAGLLALQSAQAFIQKTKGTINPARDEAIELLTAALQALQEQQP